MEVDHTDLLVIGAGPAGLAASACYRGQSLTLEQDDTVGGLCRSIEFGDCLFDIGGHSFHTPFPEVLDWVNRVVPGGLIQQKRDARVWFDDILIPYPFQNNLEHIPDPDIRSECLQGLAVAGSSSMMAGNYAEWICSRFGPGISRHFLLPYNRKLWARDLTQIDCSWVSERVAGSCTMSDPGKRSRTALVGDSVVAYPAAGGFGAICQGLAREAGPIRHNQRVIRIVPAARLAMTEQGHCFSWQRLVSTAPLPHLLDCIDEVPGNLRTAVSKLQTVHLKIVLLACERGSLAPPQRIYVADADCPAHKIAFNHRSSPWLAARTGEAVIGEVSVSASKPAPDDAGLVAKISAWLGERGLIGAVREGRVIDVPFGYPVPTHDRDAIVQAARDWLVSKGIFTIGRFGGWSYANSDACIREAMDVDGRL